MRPSSSHCLRLCLRLAALLLLAPLVTSCGPKRVQLYEGAELPGDQVTVLFSNPHFEMTIDRQYGIPSADVPKLHRIELPPGNHAVEVRCLVKDDKGQVSAMRPFALLLDGEAGHSYKPRVQFGRTPTGDPTCKGKIFDISSERGGEKSDYY